MDIAYLNVAGTFFFLCSVLDGFSRFIVHWEIRPQMIEADVEVVLQRAREAFPSARPRLISDNGPQFIARDFKAFIRLAGMTHVRVGDYVTYYNTVRLNSASGYLTPRDKLQAHAQQIFAQREAKLQAARERRRRHRGARLANPKGTSSASTSTAAQDLASQVLGFGIGLCHNLRVVRRNDTEAF